MPGKGYTEEQVELILELYKANHSYEEIAERTGRTKAAIITIVQRSKKNMKVARKGVKWTPEIVAEWRKLLQIRPVVWNYAKIAEKYGTSVATISAKLSEQ